MYYLLVNGMYVANNGQIVSSKKAALAFRTYADAKRYRSEVAKRVYGIVCTALVLR